jgi:eukaryotic-like serine/threonine-protein kinase
MILDPKQAGVFARDLLIEDEQDDGVSVPARMPEGYELIAPLGVGGMGVVYHAKHTQSGRDVAIKMLRASLASDETARRLTREARILQKLQHTGIARLLHAGWTGNGPAREPYVVLEYVAGVSMSRAASQRGWDLDKRLAVFLQVCEAVAYAHRRGVIHRDLKPGNVLVGADDQPKVVDFGLASLVEPDAATRLTVSGQVMGTLPYISPEQLEREGDVIDTRSDVYALGVMLFELLAGKPPIDVSTLPAALAIQRLREAGSPDLAAADPSLRGDLETIVRRAMDREPELRYQTVDELAADLRRYQADEPILARRASMVQGLRRFVKRHPAVVAAGIVAMVAGMVLVIQSRDAAERAKALTQQAEARARESERDRSVAQAVSSLMNELVLSPGVEGLGRDARVADVLDAAARRLDAEPPRYAEVEFAVARTLSVAYRDLALHERAVCYGERAAQAGERAFGARSAERAMGLIELARAHESWGQLDKAVAAALDAVACGEASQAKAELSEALTTLGRLYVQDVRLDEAEPILERALASARGLPEADPRRESLIGPATVELARLALTRRSSARALDLISGLTLPEPGVGTPVPYRAEAVRVKIESLAALSRFGEALPLAKAELIWHEARLPAGHPSLVRTRCVLASVLLAEGRAKEAAPFAETAADSALAALGPTHQATLDATELAATAWQAMGDLDRSDAVVARVLARLTDQDATHLAAILQLRRTQIAVSCDAGRFTEADDLFEETQRAVAALEPLGPSIRARVARLLDACEVLRESRRPK